MQRKCPGIPALWLSSPREAALGCLRRRYLGHKEGAGLVRGTSSSGVRKACPTNFLVEQHELGKHNCYVLSPKLGLAQVDCRQMEKSSILNVEIFDGRLTLRVVDDVEVWDFIEDFLVEEHGIEYEFFVSENSDASAYRRLFFSVNTCQAKLRSAVDAIDYSELECIYRLNNRA